MNFYQIFHENFYGLIYKIINYFIRNNLIGLLEVSKNPHETISLVIKSILGMESFYRFLILSLVFCYFFICIMLKFFTLGFIKSLTIYNFFAKFPPTSLLIRWLRAFYILCSKY